ncbi:MAG: hypothetical protein ACI30R_02650 [Sodaliphilus sp.]
MKSKTKSLKRMIVVCVILCAVFVAFISFQSWGTVEWLSDNLPQEDAYLWLRHTFVWLRCLLAIGLAATLLAFLWRIWRGASAGKLFVRGNHRWLYVMSALYFLYSMLDGNATQFIYRGFHESPFRLYINEYMVITCFVLVVFAKLYAIAVEVSEEQELTI